MKRPLSILLYALAAGFIAWPLGATLFAWIAYGLGSHHPADWPGWDALYYGLTFGIPALCHTRGRLPNEPRTLKAV